MANLTRGERFQAARKDINKHGKQTMREVQNATGVTASLIADLENDEKDRRASYIDVATLAKYYGVTTDWLCGISEDSHPTPCASNELGLSENSIYSLKALNDIPILFDEMWKSKDSDIQQSSSRRYWNLVDSLKCLGTHSNRVNDDYYANFLALYATELIDFLIDVVTGNYDLLCDFFDLRELDPVEWDDTVEHISFDDFVRFKAGEIAKVIDRSLVETFRNQDACVVHVTPDEGSHPGQLSLEDVCNKS